VGRKATPPSLKVIQGTNRPDRDPTGVPEFAPVREFPDPPQHLNADGAAAWSDLGPKLVAAGVLQEVDLYPLEQLCYAWQRFRKKAKADMDITASEDNALKSLWSEFGMTPAARRRVAANLLDPDAQIPKGNAFAGIGKRHS
jgi:phage terminase small subunit